MDKQTTDLIYRKLFTAFSIYQRLFDLHEPGNYNNILKSVGNRYFHDFPLICCFLISPLTFNYRFTTHGYRI